MDAGDSTKAAPFDLSRAYDVPLEELITLRDAVLRAGDEPMARLLTRIVKGRTERERTGERPAYEYRCEVIPLIPGEGGRTSVILSAYAEEGWRLAGLHLVAGRARVSTDLGGPEVQMGLAVILERAKR